MTLTTSLILIGIGLGIGIELLLALIFLFSINNRICMIDTQVEVVLLRAEQQTLLLESIRLQIEMFRLCVSSLDSILGIPDSEYKPFMVTEPGTDIDFDAIDTEQFTSLFCDQTKIPAVFKTEDGFLFYWHPTRKIYVDSEDETTINQSLTLEALASPDFWVSFPDIEVIEWMDRTVIPAS